MEEVRGEREVGAFEIACLVPFPQVGDGPEMSYLHLPPAEPSTPASCPFCSGYVLFVVFLLQNITQWWEIVPIFPRNVAAPNSVQLK